MNYPNDGDGGSGFKREQLPNMYAPVTITGGDTGERLLRNNYSKKDHARQDAERARQGANPLAMIPTQVLR